jgi:hypothetical protein
MGIKIEGNLTFAGVVERKRKDNTVYHVLQTNVLVVYPTGSETYIVNLPQEDIEGIADLPKYASELMRTKILQPVVVDVTRMFSGFNNDVQFAGTLTFPGSVSQPQPRPEVKPAESGKSGN